MFTKSIIAKYGSTCYWIIWCTYFFTPGFCTLVYYLWKKKGLHIEICCILLPPEAVCLFMEVGADQGIVIEAPLTKTIELKEGVLPVLFNYCIIMKKEVSQKWTVSNKVIFSSATGGSRDPKNTRVCEVWLLPVGLLRAHVRIITVSAVFQK